VAIPKLQFTSGKHLQTIALVLATILLSGCGNTDQAKIVGTWRLQPVDELAKRVGEDPPHNESTLETSQKSTGQDASNADEDESRNMLVEFESNGAFKTRTQLGAINNDKIGKWKFLQYNEETHVVSIECTIGLQTTQHDVKIIDDDCIEMVPPNMAGLKTKLKFERSERSISK
jgi:hypothetical protein